MKFIVDKELILNYFPADFSLLSGRIICCSDSTTSMCAVHTCFTGNEQTLEMPSLRQSLETDVLGYYVELGLTNYLFMSKVTRNRNLEHFSNNYNIIVKKLRQTKHFFMNNSLTFQK